MDEARALVARLRRTCSSVAAFLERADLVVELIESVTKPLQHLMAFRREPVVFGSPIVLGGAMLEADPATLEETMQGRIQGAFVDLED